MAHHLQEGAAAGTPPSGYVAFYAKADGQLYSKDDAGVETPLGISSSQFLDALAGLSSNGIIVRTGSASAAVRTLQAGSGISVSNGDGVLADPIVALSNTTVTPGSYGSASQAVLLTVDAQGRLTAVSATAITGVPATNITNTPAGAIAATTVQAAINELDSEKVPNARTVSAGTGLTGGGDLTADRTISMPAIGTPGTYGSSSQVPVLTTDTQGRVSGVTNTSINITNTNVDAAAAIARSKLAAGTAYYHLVNNSSGVMSEQAALYSPQKFMDIYEEFLAAGTNSAYDYGWTHTNNGAGSANSTIATATSPGAHPGVLQITTGTTAGGRAAKTLALSLLNLGGGIFTWDAAVRIPVLSDGTNRFRFYAGLGDTNAAGDMANGVYFTYLDTESSGNWQLNTANASVRTTADSSTAVTTGWVRLGFVINANATSVTFYINGTSVGTIVTNIPTTNTTGWIFKIEKSVGTTSRTAEIDYMHTNIELTTVR